MGAQTSFDGFDPASGESTAVPRVRGTHRMGGGSMRSWRAKVLVLIGVLSVVAAACGGDDNGGETGGAGGTATGGGAAECNSDMKVGVAFDIGGLGRQVVQRLRERRAATGDRRRPRVRGQRDPQRSELDRLGPRPERPGLGRRRHEHRHRGRVLVLAGDQHDRPRLPGRELHDRRRLRDLRHRVRADQRRRGDPERGRLHLQGAGGIVPGRCGGRAEVRVRDDRVPRWPAGHRPDREVPGRVRGRCASDRPERRGPRRVHR